MKESDCMFFKRKISENRKNYIVGMITSGIIFIMGVIYLTLPSYYGTSCADIVDINDLFISFSVMFAIINLIKFIILGKNPTKERVGLTIISVIAGIFNVIASMYLDANMVFAMSLLVFIILYTGVKIFSIDYYHDREDAFYYIETLLLVLFIIIGVVITFNLFKNRIVQIIMFGFFIASTGILDIINISIKSLLKSKKFIRQIKLK